MEKKYTYEDKIYGKQGFIVSKPDNCLMEVTKDGCSATISERELSQNFVVKFSSGEGSGKLARDADNALDIACKMILGKLNAKPVMEELCSQLDDLYNGIKG